MPVPGPLVIVKLVVPVGIPPTCPGGAVPIPVPGPPAPPVANNKGDGAGPKNESPPADPLAVPEFPEPPEPARKGCV